MKYLPHLWVPELRHGREEVVLDLEVEVRHPPVDKAEGPRVDVHRVVRRVPVALEG
jgi:hypothetical protein